MRFKRLLSALLALSPLAVQAQKQYLLTSPDSRIEARVSIDKQLSYNVSVRGKRVIEESPLSMTLTNGTVWGSNPRLASAKTGTVNTTVKSPFYRATDMTDRYNALTLRFKGGWNVEFRAYDDGVAYRFVSTLKKPFRVKNETAGYNFTSDATVTAAYSNGEVTNRIESQFSNSFENRYNTLPISKLERDRLMFLPLAVQTESGVKVAVTETNIENYPGMYLVAQQGRHALKAMYAPRPDRMKQVVRCNIALAVVFAASIWGIVQLTPHAVVHLFTSDTSLTDMTVWALRIYMALGFTNAFQTGFQQSFVALGEAKISLFLALERKVFLLIPFIFILPRFFENKLFAVFLAEPVADVLAAATTTVLFLIRFRKITKEM